MRNGLIRQMVVTSAACVTLAGCDVGLIYHGQPDYEFARGLSGIRTLPKPGEARATGGIDKVIEDCTLPDSTALACYWPAKNVIDYQYEVYKTNLLHAVNNGTAFGDFTVLALNTAGAVTPGAAAAKLFNALAAGATGTKAVISEDVLYKQTITILISEMDSDRATIAKANETNLAKTPVPSAAQTTNGLLAYYEAGTFQHALVTLANKAGTDATTAKTTQATTAQVVATIAPVAAGSTAGRVDCTGSTFSLSATLDNTPINVTYDVPTTVIAHPVPPGDTATNYAALNDWTKAGITAKASATAATITLTYPTTSIITWAASGNAKTCKITVGAQTAAGGT